ncbi:MAG: carboxylating nicotinate-nucleotide diphosphorylase [Cytophagaceae bacterium]|nr:carboxylating nicotinate-nucleotide diphosphorylase [Cytophagaceae bacterium]
MNYLAPEKIHQFICSALAEDLGDGDHSSISSIPEHAEGKARLLVKDQGILAGVEMAKAIFRQVDPALRVEVLLQDGVTIEPGMEALRVYGKVRSILASERLVLNCMQRMSGIATYTRYLVSLLQNTSSRLLDTRKTTPNFRICEKWAVAIGGGINHRFGLYDMIMLKDNHVDYAGGISSAIESALLYRQGKGKFLPIEIETRNLEEVKQALLYSKDLERIMLDNMSLEEMKAAVALIAGRCATEASGGVTEKTIRAIAETGVDFISVGALTHQVKSLDLSLKAF